MEKKSFLSELYNRIFGSNAYNNSKEISQGILSIATPIWVIVFLLSLFVHWQWVDNLLWNTNGYSPLFIAFVLVWVLFLDVRVLIPVNELGQIKRPIPFKYWLTTIWFVVLIALAGSTIYATHLFREKYSWECTTYYVDETNKIIHYSDYPCDNAYNAISSLQEMDGYEIKNNYTNYQEFKICNLCKENKSYYERGY